ncbi:MAG: glutaredoxin family protein [Candidatus Syntrophonatronum acetioxidans]|uniref:Glutaredoxin family protein n=1 Tax=Candidatus Syntrophonatronum acetioxidans TaxID=1795816 RepID=A0A424YFG4_9FIRM|nr:MAG: glutaredoxin family protein [Candidatus Syntrophonatronum acetioxidans]
MTEEIIVYTKSGCPYCRKLMEDYKEKGVPFKEINVSMDEEARKLVKDVLRADKVPVTVKNGKLDAIGYKGQG